MIEGNLLTENDVKIEFEDIMNYTKDLIIQNYANYGIPAPEDKELQESAMRVLQNQDEFRRVSDKVKQAKLVTLFKEKLKLDEQEVSIEEFKEIASK